MKHSLAVVILTFNESANLAQALRSVVGWADDVYVLDSESSDGTTEIARQFGCHVVIHPFIGFSEQRNFALSAMGLSNAWVLFLDADEWVSDELKAEISETLNGTPAHSGYYIKRRMIWMGRWIRRGYYPTWILRLVCRGSARCEDRAVNEHLIVEGSAGYLKHDLMHEDHKGVGDWIDKHNRYATKEAYELLHSALDRKATMIEARFFGTQAERKRWIRHHIWNRLPPLLRPFIYFTYRFVLCGGFLEGKPAFTFHFLQALWFPFLVDVKYLEMRLAAKADNTQAKHRPTAG